jgi:3D (Asp-Asp-Asp) domain-containing protein
MLAVMATLSPTKSVKPEARASPPTITAIIETPTPTEPETTQPPELIGLGEFTLTAYCPCVKCCGIWSAEHPSRTGTGYIQKTASGAIPRASRTIAVDPDVISYGTTVIINEREYVAEDRGGGVNGKHIDIFLIPTKKR